jgi:hypothetical protein
MPSGARRQHGLLAGLSCCLFALQACSAQPRPRAPEGAPALVETASEASAGPASARGTPPESNSASSLAPPTPTAPDTSLTLGVYHAAGVPALDQPWSVPDYQRCLEVFVALLRSGRGDLPRAGSARSGALFARVVDAGNFVEVREARAPGLAAGERARRLESYLEVFPGFLKVYAPASDGVDFAVEQAELLVGLLGLLKSALDGSRDFSALDASWAPTYQRQKDATLGVVRGSGSMLAEPERYPLPVRRYLKAHLAALAPALERHLDPGAAHEVHAIANE